MPAKRFFTLDNFHLFTTLNRSVRYSSQKINVNKCNNHRENAQRCGKLQGNEYLFFFLAFFLLPINHNRTSQSSLQWVLQWLEHKRRPNCDIIRSSFFSLLLLFTKRLTVSIRATTAAKLLPLNHWLKIVSWTITTVPLPTPYRIRPKTII